jgi:hypothetical protein
VRLLAVSADMSEFLAVVILRETSMSFVCIYPDCNMAKACQFEYLLGLDVLGKVMRKRGRFTVDVLSAIVRRVADICLKLIMSKPRSTNPSEMSSAGVVNGRCCATAFICFWGLG